MCMCYSHKVISYNLKKVGRKATGKGGGDLQFHCNLYGVAVVEKSYALIVFRASICCLAIYKVRLFFFFVTSTANCLTQYHSTQV